MDPGTLCGNTYASVVFLFQGALWVLSRKHIENRICTLTFRTTLQNSGTLNNALYRARGDHFKQCPGHGFLVGGACREEVGGAAAGNRASLL